VADERGGILSAWRGERVPVTPSSLTYSWSSGPLFTVKASDLGGTTGFRFSAGAIESLGTNPPTAKIDVAPNDAHGFVFPKPVPAEQTFTDVLTKPGQAEDHAVGVAAGTKTVRIAVRWTNPRNVIDVSGVRLVTRASAAAVKLKPGKLKISKRATPTSKTITVTGVAQGTLRFDVVAKTLKATDTVTTRVAQSPR